METSDCDDVVTGVVNGISQILRHELRALLGRYWVPVYGQGQTDTEMEFRKKRIQRLREIRQEFETTMHGIDRDFV